MPEEAPTVHRSVTGMPRSGSTLLVDILAQDPDTHTMSESETPQIVAQLATTFSGWPAQGRHQQGQLAEKERRLETVRRAIEGSYSQHEEKYTVDKSRGFPHIAQQMLEYYARPRWVCAVRDLRGVMGSCEKRYSMNPELYIVPPEIVSVDQRMAYWLAPGNLIGNAILGIRTMMLKDKSKKIPLFLRYEIWSCLPELYLERARAHLELPEFQHDFDSIEQTATDPDSAAMSLYPHRTEDGEPRALKPADVHEWKDHIPEEVMAGLFASPEYGPMMGWYQSNFGWNGDGIV